jgi:hypothetical protein
MDDQDKDVGETAADDTEQPNERGVPLAGQDSGPQSLNPWLYQPDLRPAGIGVNGCAETMRELLAAMGFELVEPSPAELPSPDAVWCRGDATDHHIGIMMTADGLWFIFPDTDHDDEGQPGAS